MTTYYSVRALKRVKADGIEHIPGDVGTQDLVVDSFSKDLLIGLGVVSLNGVATSAPTLIQPLSGLQAKYFGNVLVGLQDAQGNDVVTFSQPSTVATVKAKLRASIAAAEKNNAIVNTPFFKPRAWAIDTYYAFGETVLGSDGVNSYINFNAGASAHTGTGPTGTGFASIVEGACRWLWMGAARGLSAGPQTLVTFDTVANSQFANQQTFIPTVANPIVTFPGKLTTVSGGVCALGSNSGTVAVPVFGTGLTTIALFTNSTKIYFDSVSYMGTVNMPYRVEINDTRVQDAGVTIAQANGTTTAMPNFNPGSMKIDLSGFGGQNVMKKVLISYSNNSFGSPLNKIRIEAGAVLLPVNNPARLNILVEGDSLTQGGNSVPYAAGRDWPTQFGTLSGQDGVINLAQGGTGFKYDNVGAKTNYVQRASDLLARGPDLILNGGNHNDLSYTSAERQAAVTAWHDAVRALSATVPIGITGPMPLFGDTVATLILMEQDIQAAIAALNDPLTFFIPIWTDPAGPWYIGNTVSQASAPTNSNMDGFYNNSESVGLGSHLNQRGTDYHTQRVFHGVKAWAMSA